MAVNARPAVRVVVLHAQACLTEMGLDQVDDASIGGGTASGARNDIRASNRAAAKGTAAGGRHRMRGEDRHVSVLPMDLRGDFTQRSMIRLVVLLDAARELLHGQRRA